VRRHGADGGNLPRALTANLGNSGPHAPGGFQYLFGANLMTVGKQENRSVAAAVMTNASITILTLFGFDFLAQIFGRASDHQPCDEKP